jgi:hypothetical protein
MFVSFDIGISLSDPAWAAVAPTRYWTQIAVCTFHCESIIAVAHASPGPPSASAAGAALGGAAASAASGATPAALAADGAALGPGSDQQSTSS